MTVLSYIIVNRFIRVTYVTINTIMFDALMGFHVLYLGAFTVVLLFDAVFFSRFIYLLENRK